MGCSDECPFREDVEKIAEAAGLVDYPEGQGPQYGDAPAIIRSIQTDKMQIRMLQVLANEEGMRQQRERAEKLEAGILRGFALLEGKGAVLPMAEYASLLELAMKEIRDAYRATQATSIAEDKK